MQRPKAPDGPHPGHIDCTAIRERITNRGGAASKATSIPRNHVVAMVPEAAPVLASIDHAHHSAELIETTLPAAVFTGTAAGEAK